MENETQKVDPKERAVLINSLVNDGILKDLLTTFELQCKIFDAGVETGYAAATRESSTRMEVLEREVERLNLMVFSPLGDNHHNARACPYCREGDCGRSQSLHSDSCEFANDLSAEDAGIQVGPWNAEIK